MYVRGISTYIHEVVLCTLSVIWLSPFLANRHGAGMRYFHWKQKIVNLTALSSLVALYVVIMTNYGATCDDNADNILLSVSRVVTVWSHDTTWSQGRHMRICRAVIELLYSCPFVDACHKVVSKSSYNDSVIVTKSSLRSNIFTESSTSRLKIIFHPSKSCHSSQ